MTPLSAKMAANFRWRASAYFHCKSLLEKCAILLLDEATASLDVENETLIQASLSQLMKNKTVLLIAHRMRTVAGADQIIVLKKRPCGRKWFYL